MVKKLIWTLLLFVWMPSMVLAQPTPAHTTNKHKKTIRHHQIAHKNSHQSHQTHKKIKTHAKNKKKINPPNGNLAAFDEIADAENTAPIKLSTPSFSFVSSMQHRLVDFVHQTVDSVRYSAYKLGGRHFDTTRGIYVLDCSDYVDNILETVHPRAYWSLADATGSDKPTSQHYYEFFSGLSEYPSYYWNKVDDVEKLEPGDILVFRKTNAMHRQIAGGHVMVVMNKPVLDEDAYLVRVADSAPSGHSSDTRQGHSGIGIGTILLKVDSKTGRPSAYAWKVGSRWKQNVTFAMARPVTMS